MKSGAQKKITAATPLPAIPRTPLRSGEKAPAGFFRMMVAASGLTQKEVATAGRVNDTTCEGWMNGSRPDPLERARDMFCALTRRNKGIGPNILAYVAGGDEFDGGILNKEEWEAAMIVARAVLAKQGKAVQG